MDGYALLTCSSQRDLDDGIALSIESSGRHQVDVSVSEVELLQHLHRSTAHPKIAVVEEQIAARVPR